MDDKGVVPEKKEEKHLKEKGKKALIVNIIFFIALFLVILITPRLGIAASAVLITLIFIASLLYIYRF